MTDRIKTVLAVYLLLEVDERLLLLRRQNSGWQDGRLSVPAGHVDAGESARSAMLREAYEEIGVTIEAGDLELVHVMHRNDEPPYVDLYFRCVRWIGVARIMEPHKASELQWAQSHALPSDVIPTVRQAVEALHQGLSYSDDAWIGDSVVP